MKAHLGAKLAILSHIIRRRIDQMTEEYGLSGPQSRILHYIAINSKKQDVFQRDVENEFHIRRSSVTSLVQQLEKSGWIKRISVESDARLKKLILTEKAVLVQNELAERIDEFEKSLLDMLKENQESFVNQLDYLIDELDDLKTGSKKEGKND